MESGLEMKGTRTAFHLPSVHESLVRIQKRIAPSPRLFSKSVSPVGVVEVLLIYLKNRNKRMKEKYTHMVIERTFEIHH